MADTKFGTFADIVKMTPSTLRPVTHKLHDIIMSVDPDSCLVVRLGDRAATFGVGPKKMSEGYCYIIPHTNWVNLGFYQGALLNDPEGLLEGTGAKMRHIKIRSLEACENPKLMKMIADAVKKRKTT